MASHTETPTATARRYLTRALEEADDDAARIDIRQALQLLEAERAAATDGTGTERPPRP